MHSSREGVAELSRNSPKKIETRRSSRGLNLTWFVSSELTIAAKGVPMPPLFAYFDPGSGSMLLQAIVGGTAGLLVFARYLWEVAPIARRQRKGQEALSERDRLQYEPVGPDLSHG
jgi:hypothetical protein